MIVLKGLYILDFVENSSLLEVETKVAKMDLKITVSTENRFC